MARGAAGWLLAWAACVAAAPPDLLAGGGGGGGVADILRRDGGDEFVLTDGGACGAERCAEYAAGGGGGGHAQSNDCACACPAHAPLFREDRALCVQDIAECALADYGTGPAAQKIPVVFLPLKGQIIHPSKDISFPGVKTPICAVSGAQFLAHRGFVDLRNTQDADVPFTLFRDEGRTFLQWSGETELRARMSGRVVLVRLLCRDVWAAPAAPAAPAVDLRGVFTPCVAFRVQGSPVQHISNVSEIQFALNAATDSSRLSVSEYVAIGVSSVLLGLIYVASVFLYLHIKKKKRSVKEENCRQKALKGLKNKDGAPIREQDIVRVNNDRVHSLPTTLNQPEGGITRNNPLLNSSRKYHEFKNYLAENGSQSDSEEQVDIERNDNSRANNQLTSVIIHPNSTQETSLRRNSFIESVYRDESGIERLPDEHVSIVETTDNREDKTDIVRPIGNTRRKLYFNPAYFEPHLMAEPPPAALEFLTKIREVIAIAKHKMSSKRFQPVLHEIPEEETYQTIQPNLDFYQGMGSQRSGSAISLKRENSRKRPCVGCPGCTIQSHFDLPNNTVSYNGPTACSNCLSQSRGDKQNSIRKWLDQIPIESNTFYTDVHSQNQTSGLLNSLLSLPSNDPKSRLKKQNSYCKSLFSDDGDYNFSFKKKSSTVSVRSEPIIRNYNLPLPDFGILNIPKNSNGRYSNATSTPNSVNCKLREYTPASERIPFSQRRNNFITNKNSLPDMVSEAVAIDNSKSFNHSSSDEEKVYSKTSFLANLSRNSSSSPQGVGYETDSLERNSVRNSSQTDFPEDVPSSQASPSLSTALPLEEELTMTNAVYKESSHSDNSNTYSPNKEMLCDPTNHYETVGEQRLSQINSHSMTTNAIETGTADYSLVSEVYVNNYNFGSTPSSPNGSECSMGSRKLIGNINQEPDKPGCLTIIVRDPPENYIKIHESDGFEPDTLDRKHPKNKNYAESTQFSRKDLLNNIQNDDRCSSPQSLRLNNKLIDSEENLNGTTKKFNSLRELYEYRNNTFIRPKISDDHFSGSKSLIEMVTTNPDFDWKSEEGRILTLEMRHSKRQRQCTPPSMKNLKILARPDVLPPLPPSEQSPIYEQPAFPPRKVELLQSNNITKNSNGRGINPTMQPNHREFHSKGEPSFGPQPEASVLRQHPDYQNAKTISGVVEANRDKSVLGLKVRGNETKQNIDSKTYVKPHNVAVVNPVRQQRRSQHKVDSGYLSSDSTCSQNRTSQGRRSGKTLSGSESEDTENEARSESGAESVETHSVFFGSIRKLSLHKNECVDGNTRHNGFSRGNSRKIKNGSKTAII